MSSESKVIYGFAAYLLAAIVTFGHAYHWYLQNDRCDYKAFCVSPGELAAYSSLFWPFYWSFNIWGK